MGLSPLPEDRAGSEPAYRLELYCQAACARNTVCLGPPFAARPRTRSTVDREAAITQASPEPGIVAGRPDRQDPVAGQRGTKRRQAAGAVQTCVRRGGERRRAIVDVEQDSVEASRVALQSRGDVRDVDGHARIVERVVGQRAQRSAVPLDHCGEQLRDDDRGRRRQEVQCGHAR